MNKSIFFMKFFTVIIIFFVACNDNSFVPDNLDNKNIISEKTDKDYTENFILWAEQNYNVGDLHISNNGSILTITYKTAPGYLLTETHLHLADSLNEIPKEIDDVIPGLFDFKSEDKSGVNTKTYEIPLQNIDKNGDKNIFIAAHAIVKSELDSSNLEFPTKVKMNYYGQENFGYPSSFNLKINKPENVAGIYDGWCLGYNVDFNENDYDAKLFFSYINEKLNPELNNYKNLDLINWVINQHFVGKNSSCGEVYNLRDVQIAIWYLLGQFDDEDWKTERASNWDGYASECRVKDLVEMAFTEGKNYVPNCGEYMGIVIEPTNGYQPVIIEAKIPCGFIGEKSCWAGYENKDFPFPGKNWSMYINFKL